jgi:hypothetical protein
MDIEKVLKHIQKDEWSMGNGQCRECCGVHAGWYGHPLHMEKESIGHEPGCQTGESVRELGGETLFKGEFTPTSEQQKYRDERAEVLKKLFPKEEIEKYIMKIILGI